MRRYPASSSPRRPTRAQPVPAAALAGFAAGTLLLAGCSPAASTPPSSSSVPAGTGNASSSAPAATSAGTHNSAPTPSAGNGGHPTGGGSASSARPPSAALGRHRPADLPQPELPRVTLTWTCPNGTAPTPLDVELAAKPADQNRGLAYRESLAPNRGMLFPNVRPGVGVTLADMLFALDIVWLDKDHVVTGIARDRQPTLEPVYSSPSTVGFLEIPAGTAARTGIDTGCRGAW